MMSLASVFVPREDGNYVFKAACDDYCKVKRATLFA